MTPVRSLPSSRVAVSQTASLPGELETKLIRGLLIALRRDARVASAAELASAIGFAVFDGPWTARAGATLWLQRELFGCARDRVIAQQLGAAIGEWVPRSCAVALCAAIEAELTPAACASADPRAS